MAFKEEFIEKEKKISDLNFLGMAIFRDSLKKTAKEAILTAENLGVQVKILTGDRPEVAKKNYFKINRKMKLAIVSDTHDNLANLKKANLKIFLIFLVLGFLIYANSFSNQLFWDDYDNIVNNAYIKSWKFIPNYFTENLIAGAGLHSNYWRPLLLFSFSLDYKIWKLNPFGYHLTNTLLHIFNAFLVYFLLFLIFKNKKISFLTALIFLLHPLQTEAVTYVSGRGDSLSVFFILISFLFYIFAKRKKEIKYLVLSSLFFIFALLSKESVIFFPVFIFLYEIFFSKKPKEIFLRILPFFLIGGVYFVSRVTILNFGQTLNLYGEENIFTQNIHFRIFTFLKILLIYYSLYFAPIYLHMERATEILTTFFHPAVIFSSIILLTIIFLSIYFFKKRNKIFAFGFGWFFISLFPFSNILVPISGLLYEHWLYFPLVGISLILAWFFLEFLPTLTIHIKLPWQNYMYGMNLSRFLQPISFSLIVIFLVFLSVRTIVKNFDWRDPITFYNRTLKYSETARVHNNLAMAYSDKKDFEKAMFHYQRAIEISDIYPQTHNNLGNLYKEMGEIKKAIEEFEKAIKMDKYFLFAYYNLVNLYLEQKDFQSAVSVLERILEIQPENQQILNLIEAIKNESR